MRPYFERLTEQLRVVETSAAPFPEHLHPQAELLYLFEGSAVMRVDGQAYAMEPGDLCASFPGVVHGYQESGGERPARALMLIFSPELFGDFSATMSHFAPETPLLKSAQLPSDVGLCMEQLRQECARGADERALRGYIQVTLARAMPLMPLVSRPREVPDVSYGILKYLSDHFAEPVTLESLARALGVSKSYLSHTFSQRFGANFRTYVNTLRLDYACMLLRSTDRGVTHIAYECGFESQRTFNRAFAQQYGLTPSQYRRASRPATAEEEAAT